MRVHPSKWKETQRFTSSRAAFARRLTGHERRPPEETCELVVGPTRSSSIFVRASLMSCTLLSHRSCSVVESDCSKALTCGLWDTNALNLQRRRRPPMLFCGTKGPRTPVACLVRCQGDIMTVKRMDNVGIVVEDIDAAIEFFTELGLELEGRAPVEGDWADGVTGLRDMRVEIAMMRTPDGHSLLEVSEFLAAPVRGAD